MESRGWLYVWTFQTKINSNGKSNSKDDLLCEVLKLDLNFQTVLCTGANCSKLKTDLRLGIISIIKVPS